MKFAAVILMSMLPLFQSSLPTTAAMNKAAVAELQAVLNERKMFIKVHAAEYLTWTGNAALAREAFLKENAAHGTEPKYRITIWRILAQADKANKQQWLDKIYAAYADENGPDRIHASETLAKLKQPVYKKYPELTDRTIASPETALHLYALWASGYGDAARMASVRQKMLTITLTDTNIVARRISAYSLRFIKGLAKPQWEQLANEAEKNDVASPFYTAHYCAALLTAPNRPYKRLRQMKFQFLQHLPEFNAGQRTEVCQMLAEAGTKDDLALLWLILKNENVDGKYNPAADEGADLRATAAYAILKINSRLK